MTAAASTAASPVEADRSKLTAKAKNVTSSATARFVQQAEQLSLRPHDAHSTTAAAARFITPRDPVIETVGGERLPAVPLVEARRLNQLKEEIRDEQSQSQTKETKEEDGDTQVNQMQSPREQRNEEWAQNAVHRQEGGKIRQEDKQNDGDEAVTGTVNEADQNNGRTAATLTDSAPPSTTNPLFPPLPLYGPPSLTRTLQCWFLRFTSFWLSLGFLLAIVIGSAVTSLPLMFQHIRLRLQLKDPDARRPFHQQEKARRTARRQAEADWTKRERKGPSSEKNEKDSEESVGDERDEFVPTEGGPAPLRADAPYYARRVGLDVEVFKVQTEDGFVLTLWHVYNPKEYTPATNEELHKHRPEVFIDSGKCDPDSSPCAKRRRRNAPKRYPVLLMHGLLQSAGAYCCNDDESLAFYLAKCGYDVWLGNNRCGFEPEHTLLTYGDPRMWCFNIRQMGVLDLPAFVSRVLYETGFPKLGLVCHSQGTTQTFVALAKDQRPDLGQRVSVFCALAPAVYAGPLIGKMYFKFMKIISPSMFRIFFGIHAFIPFMMTMHAHLPGLLYGAMGYRVFSFLFNWTDTRWERDLRDRQFQFAPVYVSAESMRWWLGRECFAKHKCILATREQAQQEDAEDEAEDDAEVEDPDITPDEHRRRAWYDDNAPPMALWVGASDKLVDGRRLIRRFERGREPDVKVVHTRVIDEYEHLDVLWAMDAIDKVGREVKEVIWQTAERTEGCAVPKGCAALKRLI